MGPHCTVPLSTHVPGHLLHVEGGHGISVDSQPRPFSPRGSRYEFHALAPATPLMAQDETKPSTWLARTLQCTPTTARRRARGGRCPRTRRGVRCRSQAAQKETEQQPVCGDRLGVGSQGRGASGALGPARLGSVGEHVTRSVQTSPRGRKTGRERSKTGVTCLLQLLSCWW